jgi:hypothetical protein
MTNTKNCSGKGEQQPQFSMDIRLARQQRDAMVDQQAFCHQTNAIHFWANSDQIFNLRSATSKPQNHHMP